MIVAHAKSPLTMVVDFVFGEPALTRPSKFSSADWIRGFLFAGLIASPFVLLANGFLLTGIAAAAVAGTFPIPFFRAFT
ncbi:MAG: hypothetical protein P4L53_23940 [Candidatus Obscuribacterales bacterium]|nr:hypothetical protein [Candidatus Obscuribacterales bacterium]